MAKKRLNKKVALIGSAIFMLIVFVAIAVIFHLSRDPEKFIKDHEHENEKLRNNIKNYPDLVEKNLRYSYMVINSKSREIKENMKRSLNGKKRDLQKKHRAI